MITVIVPIYKVEKYIKNCIDSIRNQTFTDLEIILVDDGSPDSCPQICDHYAEIDSRIKVIHKKNGGLSSARNAGLDVASGDFVSFVDSDDWIDKDMYKDMMGIFLKDSSIQMVACNIKSYNETTHLYARFMGRKDRYIIKKDTIFYKEQYQRLTLSNQIESAAWNKLYKRSLIGDLRFKEGRLYEDYLFIAYIGDKLEKMNYLSKSYYNYRIRDNSITSVDHYEETEKNFHDLALFFHYNKKCLNSIDIFKLRFYLEKCNTYKSDKNKFKYFFEKLKKIPIKISIMPKRLLIKYILFRIKFSKI